MIGIFIDLNRVLQWSASIISFQLLNESRILVATVGDHGHPQLLLCDISSFVDHSLPCLRIYNLPEIWSSICSIDIRPNISPCAENRTTPGTFFYPDPSSRILVVSIKFNPAAVPVGYSEHMMLIFQESLLRPLHNDASILAWSQWGQHCLLRDISDEAFEFSVVGRRLVQLETVGGPDSLQRRLRFVEFNPRFVDWAHGSPGYHSAWRFSGRGTALTNDAQSNGFFPNSRSYSVDMPKINNFSVTEDNLILVEVRLIYACWLFVELILSGGRG